RFADADERSANTRCDSQSQRSAAPEATRVLALAHSRRKVTFPLVRAECSLTFRLPHGGIAGSRKRCASRSQCPASLGAFALLSTSRRKGWLPPTLVQNAVAALDREFHRHFNRAACSGLELPLQQSFDGKFV